MKKGDIIKLKENSSLWTAGAFKHYRLHLKKGLIGEITGVFSPAPEFEAMPELFPHHSYRGNSYDLYFSITEFIGIEIQLKEEEIEPV